MTLTFAGLIRAHGDGGTGSTTIDPENTYVTTNSGTTTTFDLEGTYYTTIGNTTTFDLEETYETTVVATTDIPGEQYKAKCIDWGKPVVQRKIFEIGNRKLELVMYYRVVAVPPSPFWNSWMYRTKFEAILKQKISGDPDAGPYTGVPSSESTANPLASTKYRRYDLNCNPESGAITATSTVEVEVENSQNQSRELIYDFGGTYKLEFSDFNHPQGDDIVMGPIFGNGSNWIITRDKALAQLTKIEADADLNQAVVIVDSDDIKYVPNPLPNYDYGANEEGCYVISSSEETPD